MLTALSILWTIAVLPRERPVTPDAVPPLVARRARTVWRNRDARVLLFVYGIEQLGIGGIGVLVPFVSATCCSSPI